MLMLLVLLVNISKTARDTQKRPTTKFVRRMMLDKFISNNVFGISANKKVIA